MLYNPHKSFPATVHGNIASVEVVHDFLRVRFDQASCLYRPDDQMARSFGFTNRELLIPSFAVAATGLKRDDRVRVELAWHSGCASLLHDFDVIAALEGRPALARQEGYNVLDVEVSEKAAEPALAA